MLSPNMRIELISTPPQGVRIPLPQFGHAIVIITGGLISVLIFRVFIGQFEIHSLIYVMWI